MKKTSLISRVRHWVKAHKLASIVIVIVIGSGIYYIYHRSSAANSTPQYVLTMARTGSVTQTVTGSGQVSAENQLDVTSEVSSKVQTINVTVGQHVNKGDLLVSLDAHDAAISLESARIAYAKLVQPAKDGDLTNAKNSVTKAYTDAYNAASSLHLDLPGIMSGTKSMLYDADGFLSDQYTSNLISTARTYRDTAGRLYDRAAEHYATSLRLYKESSRSSASSTIDTLIDDSYQTAQMVATALQALQNTLTYVTTYQPDYHAVDAAAAASSITTWSTQINSDLSSIVSAQSGIASAENNLSTLIHGADTLDVQSQRLSLQQAQETYANYFIRAPFDGIVGRIPVSVYGQAGASTIVATIIGDRKIANISLNEVDAAKVNVGQPVTITFDAIDGLNATGTVERVDLVGTVSQGVVSYTVRVAIDTQDDRIKPGMSMNVSIATKVTPDVLIVPSTAIKTQNGKKYVEILPESALPASTTAMSRNSGNLNRTNGTGSSSPMMYGQDASSTGGYAFRSGQNTGSTRPARTVNVTTAVTPIQVSVTTGDTDDTNTQIVSGLERGQWVITRTIASGTATTATPNILTSIGGNRAGGGATRAVARPGN